ncbi:hypothetical protein NQ315_002604 [Exocentrus adspersus]|uniref:Uncharacterized protein n=1 Tax=Exocentrus adspersus TaxID=1586481 RepID=A0AAV8VU31_9CUCU|nr:hypothetical protein NQ315_002604 [Exocentrus adspersus]
MGCTADGVLLPPYIIYKAEHLYDSWTERGPKGARYNRTKSGWMDGKLPEEKKLTKSVLFLPRFLLDLNCFHLLVLPFMDKRKRHLRPEELQQIANDLELIESENDSLEDPFDSDDSVQDKNYEPSSSDDEYSVSKDPASNESSDSENDSEDEQPTNLANSKNSL